MCRPLIVIPARYASTRLPRKMLLDRTGKPLIRHTYEAASRSRLAEGVVVATDHPEIEAAIRSFGGNVLMTDPDARSGTDRVAEIARRLPEYDLLVNVQGDEPEIEAAAIDRAIELLRDDPAAVMATLGTPLRDRKRLEDPAAVKLVKDRSDNALYFSRSVIPHPRSWSDSMLAAEPPLWLLHLGLYVFRRDFVIDFGSLPPSPLETTEMLEQLRVLEAGYRIKVGVVERSAGGIDTPEDYEAFVSRSRR
ncbi:MAG TPA: 3-deoxy-manno-octulosonate cytidylyltransferase [Planctomycetaceae bacterium]|nr:3-deoxy-manno-octulosonate cytidylyltransferase [Planctomycetaceae bacterium]HRF02409.1 3-deoxy-manno-octulosonate cytidylyltransferase [Pirellulaceae bacterium]